MKKLFTIDDIAVAFIAALGYGFGETIAKLVGWPEPLCMVASFALGIVLEEIISKICFSKAVQKKPINRVITYAVIFLIFVTAQYISTRWMGVSMLDYVKEEILSVVGLPILGFIVNLLVRGYRIGKIRKIYGDGSEGYVFDVDREDIEEINQQNQQILGKYDDKYAVKTRTGIYVGRKYKKCVLYLGIPYAMPPVGERRWKAPEPLLSSDAVFEARYFGASAIQVEHKGSILKHHRQNEDCLTLNICVSAKETEAKKPVLVLFHPGDFTSGGSADPLLYGNNFVSKHPDVVFVSFNYRLGIFGFIDFSEIPGGEGFPDALNLGLLDQIAALKWIRENIAAFGGDPDRITALGFESGATSIYLLAASGRGKDLFRRAFLFDGNPATVHTSPEISRALAKKLMEETRTSTMQELSELKTEALKDAAQRLWQDMCAPTCDGAWLPVDLALACQEGSASGIEFVIGFPSNEMQVYRSLFGDQNYESLISAAAKELQGDLDGPLAKAVAAYIETQTAELSALEAKSKLVEQWNTLGIYRSAVKLAEGGNRVHLMFWDEKPLIENLGSGTVDVAAALLGNDDALQMYGSVMQEDLSETLQLFLMKFISAQALQLYPNELKGVDAINWKAFPKALIVSDEMIECDTIEDRLTDIRGLLAYALSY
jgi:para-nitrobenzyl esterase